MTIMITEIYEAFKDAGADDEKAVAAAQAVPAPEIMATKTDVAEVRVEVAEFRAEVAEFRSEIKAEMAGLRGEVGRQIGRVYWHLWLMGAGLLAAMVGLRLFG